jgi:O-antigen ligase/tetratricopeptide (TPR) repeat protein
MMTKKAKKIITTIPVKTDKVKSIAADNFSVKDIIPLILIIAYIAADFIPGDKTADVMGGQWFFISIVNIASCFYIFFSRNAKTTNSISKILTHKIIILYSLFFLVALVSVFFALNKTESAVVLARISSTFLMLINLGILLSRNTLYFKLLAQVFSLILLLQALINLNIFFEGLGEIEINRLIYNLKGNAANKNILAASLVIKIPFSIYCIITFKNWLYKSIHILALGAGSLLIFILNARAAYLSMLILLLLFLILYLFVQHRQGQLKKSWSVLASVIVPVLISLFLSIKIISNAIENDYETPYGTVTERLGSIKLTAEGTNARLAEWGNALKYLRMHPFTGSGIGNWKLASIPLERNTVDELMVTYHVHNDFLEAAVETGIVGGILYFLIFAVTGILLLKRIFTNITYRGIVYICLLLGLTSYIIDALLNFPMERPVMQIMLCFILGFVVSNLNHSEKSSGEKNVFGKATNVLLISLFTTILGFSAFVNYQSYKSLKLQVKVNKDMNLEKPVTTWREIINEFPSIPNLNMYCFPISHIKAFYLMEDKKYDEALTLINNNTHINPYLSLTEYLKGKIFLYKEMIDSAYIYAKKGFWMKPRARSNYLLLSDVCTLLKDSLTLNQAFTEYKKFRNDAWIWNNYIGTMINLSMDKKGLLQKTDTALALFPDDTELKNKKRFLDENIKQGLITPEKSDEFQKYFATGLAASNNKQFNEAIRYFTLASAANPNDYLSLENIGVCYYSLKEYQTAIIYLNKVLEMKIATDGKAEFIKGACLLSLAQKEEGCYYLNIANNKNYSAALPVIQANCK